MADRVSKVVMAVLAVLALVTTLYSGAFTIHFSESDVRWDGREYPRPSSQLSLRDIEQSMNRSVRREVHRLVSYHVESSEPSGMGTDGGTAELQLSCWDYTLRVINRGFAPAQRVAVVIEVPGITTNCEAISSSQRRVAVVVRNHQETCGRSSVEISPLALPRLAPGEALSVRVSYLKLDDDQRPDESIDTRVISDDGVGERMPGHRPMGVLLYLMKYLVDLAALAALVLNREALRRGFLKLLRRAMERFNASH